jgi:hypothetical protein
MRARIRARFADLHHQREQTETELAALAKTTPAATDPGLLDELPLLGDILPGLPPALKARLLAAFGIEILWNKPGQQVTVFAEITDSTLQAIPGLTDPGQDGYHDTSPQTSNDPHVSMGHLNNTPRFGREGHSLKWMRVDLGRFVTFVRSSELEPRQERIPPYRLSSHLTSGAPLAA